MFGFGTVVGYSNDIKMDQLDVSPIDIEKYGAASEQVAKQMAIGVRERFDVDFSVSTSELQFPRGNKEKPVGTIAVGVSSSKGDYANLPA